LLVLSIPIADTCAARADKFDYAYPETRQCVQGNSLPSATHHPHDGQISGKASTPEPSDSRVTSKKRTNTNPAGQPQASRNKNHRRFTV